MYFRFVLKPKRKRPVAHPALERLGAVLRYRTADLYFGEDVSWISTIFCIAHEEAERRGTRLCHEGTEVEINLPCFGLEDGPSSEAGPDLLLAEINRSLELFGAAFDSVRSLLGAEHPCASRLLELRERLVGQVTEPELRSLPDDERPYVLRRLEARSAALSENPRPLKRRLEGIRVYDSEGATALGRRGDFERPIDLIVDTLLRNSRLQTPGYREIYIYLAPTKERAMLKKGTPHATHWAEYAFGGFDFDRFAAASVHERESMYIDSLELALLEKAREDHLDAGAIRRAFIEVRAFKSGERLVAFTRENKEYEATVLFEPVDGEIPFFLTVVRKNDQRRQTRPIGVARDVLQAFVRFSTVQFTKSVVRVKSRKSLRASINLAGAPDVVEFKLSDLFGESLRTDLVGEKAAKTPEVNDGNE